jgi:hypothetical protein
VQKDVKSSIFSTHVAAHVILGGTQGSLYWGFGYEDFASRFHHGVVNRIGDPLAAPWRNALGFATSDYIELDRAMKSMDFSPDPANHLDENMAKEFMQLSDFLGIAGPIGAGKDTAADVWVSEGFAKISFADPLRLASSILYGIPLRYFNQRELKEEPLPNSSLSPRRVLQMVGGDVCREISDQIWVKRAKLRAASALLDINGYFRNALNKRSAKGGIKVVIPDVRYQNEADFVRSLGGRVVRINRPSLIAQVLAAAGGGHSSEAGFTADRTDIHLVNDGSVDRFRADALRIVSPAPATASSKKRRPT